MVILYGIELKMGVLLININIATFLTIDQIYFELKIKLMLRVIYFAT
jgi:hypothetical protein